MNAKNARCRPFIFIKNNLLFFGNKFEKAVSNIIVRRNEANEQFEFFSDGEDKKAEYVLQ